MADDNYFVGMDVGSTICKAVAINSGEKKIVSQSTMQVLGDPEKAANFCLKELAKNLNCSIKALKNHAIATGQNSDKISFEEKESEITCIGKGVYNLNPSVRIVIDVGSFSMKALKMESDGKIVDYMMNNRCAGGSGILLELIGEALELNVADLANKALEAKNPITISSQCSIFAESEVISYKNEGANISDLIAGVCNSIAGRLYPIVKSLDKEPRNVAFTGGVAKNKKVALNLEDRLNLKLIELPIDPQLVTAFGAAIVAKERGGA